MSDTMTKGYGGQSSAAYQYGPENAGLPDTGFGLMWVLILGCVLAAVGIVLRGRGA